MVRIKTIVFIILAFSIFLLNGCGSSSSSSNTSVAPFTFEAKNIYLQGGQSETYTLTLSQDGNVSATGVVGIFDKIAATLSPVQYNMVFSSSNEAVVTISPANCVLSTATPTCQVTVTANDLWNSNDGKLVVGKANLNAVINQVNYQIAAVETASDAPSRIVSFENKCPFDVWADFAPSSAAQMACTPNGTPSGANPCPSGYVCYSANVATTNYCVPGKVNSNYTSGNVTSQSMIDLNASRCPSKTVDTNSADTTWGQCTCALQTAGQCQSQQTCRQVSSGINQCYYDANFDTNKSFGALGLIPAGTTTASTGGKLPYIQLPLSNNPTSTVFYSGNFYFKTGCDSNGANCLASASNVTPLTRIEFTLLNSGNDFYDVSYINGVNVPVMMAPKFRNDMTIDWNASQPYYCTPAGGTDADLNASVTKYPNISNSLLGFGSAFDWNSTIDANKATMQGYNFVSDYSGTGTQNCSTSGDCGGQTCGLTYANVLAGSTQTTCGARLGYWTYAQFCSVNTSGGYKNSAIGVDCTNTTKKSYSLCQPQVAGQDQGAARSCFNSNQTTSGDSCCGFASWQNSSGTAMPFGSDSNITSIAGVVTTNWKSYIYSAVSFIKNSALTAYSYQYDDPYSTFQCAYKTPNSIKTSQNATNYKITLCPQGKTGGIATYNSALCKASVSASTSSGGSTTNYTTNNFEIALPGGTTPLVTITSVTDVTTPSSPNVLSAVYNGSNAYYIYNLQNSSWSGKIKIVAQSASDGTYQTCYFTSTPNSCFALAAESASSASICNNWISPNSSWSGRYFTPPPFSNGSKSPN
ncbi:MAG: hypothetical protein RL154_440 [Pseudomonadota bacterium]